MQRMIKGRLVRILENDGGLPNVQSGCRKGRSCQDHLTRLESEIRKAQYEGKKLMAVFLDLSNAFDRAWNNGIMIHLARLGVQGNMLRKMDIVLPIYEADMCTVQGRNFRTCFYGKWLPTGGCALANSV